MSIDMQFWREDEVVGSPAKTMPRDNPKIHVEDHSNLDLPASAWGNFAGKRTRSWKFWTKVTLEFVMPRKD